QYHPSSIAEVGKTKYQCSMRFNNIDRRLMLDDGFWLMFWRLQLVASDDHDQHVIYDVLIPHLTGRTVAASVAERNDPLAEWRTPQRAGNCYYKSVLECFRYLCRCHGLGKDKTKQLLF